MSYFDFFCTNIQECNTDSEAIRGTCMEMCPEQEVTMREKERMVHVLEVWGPIVRKYVKSYCRSAADLDVAVPSLLRPYPVLKDTVQHLILDCTKRIDLPTACRYDYINDRLRAVRQDMTIQRLPPEQCAHLLEPMIRFYVFYGYKLCDAPLKDFDPVLNKKYLLECMKWYLTCTKDDQLDEISGLLSNLDLKYKLKSDKVLIESLYILCNMNDLNPLFRYLALSTELASNPKLKLAYDVSIANQRGNYIRVCQLMEMLCPLQLCAISLYLPTLQKQALQVMSHAYNSKTLTMPAAVLRRWLRFNSDDEVVKASQHYGMTAEGGVVSFSKAEFKRDAPTLQPTKQLQLENKHDFTVNNIFTYVSQ
ncbi:hypothetical protein O0L34_g6803 [Tuta absoluta]|nr:hypothetical protein O0L34_g6803 [Tuta absoluta]